MDSGRVDIGQFFQAREFRCRGWENLPKRKCCCRGAMLWDPRLIDILEIVREEIYGGPVGVLNGHRCSAYNESVNGWEQSYHLTGRAADIRHVDDEGGSSIQETAAAIGEVAADLLPMGLGNVLFYPHRHFIHVDTGPTRSDAKMVRISRGKPKVEGRH